MFHHAFENRLIYRNTSAIIQTQVDLTKENRDGTDSPLHDLAALRAFYEGARERINSAKDELAIARGLEGTAEETRAQIGLTLHDKIMIAHMTDEQRFSEVVRGQTYVKMMPDFVGFQDATAQMAFLQFITTEKREVAVACAVFLDHLTVASCGALADLQRSIQRDNKEVYDFLRSVADKFGLGFWEAGSGIIHALMLERYGFPLGLFLTTDSHGPTTDLAQETIGAGGAEAVDPMVGDAYEVLAPKVMGIKLTGKLSPWATSKDLIQYVVGQVTTKGGVGMVAEYFGEGLESLSATDISTLGNMGAESSFTTTTAQYTKKMGDFMRATGRIGVADTAEEFEDLLKADPIAIEQADQHYDRVIEVDLSQIKPSFSGPNAPDAYHTFDDIDGNAEIDIPQEVSHVLIGSCTNSDYPSLKRALEMLQEALRQGVELKTKIGINCGSNTIKATLERDGLLEGIEGHPLVDIYSNSCSACIGKWEREIEANQDDNTIFTTFNRNFPKRNDGSEKTKALMGSPEMAVAVALKGTFLFDPETTTVEASDGREISLPLSEERVAIPSEGFAKTELGYHPPSMDPGAEIIIKEGSDRVQLLEAFPKWNLSEDGQMAQTTVLTKLKGTVTTDTLSQAGKWLKHRGHLPEISGNYMTGGGPTSAYHPAGVIGKIRNKFDQEYTPIAVTNSITGEVQDANSVAFAYREAGVTWGVVAETYAEGSSREHAAMEPRYLGCGWVLAKTFIRLAETNLKKQGMLPLRFVDPADYDRVLEDDKVTIVDAVNIQEGQNVTVLLEHADGTSETIQADHSMSTEQLEWFKAGSCLNYKREMEAAA